MGSAEAFYTWSGAWIARLLEEAPSLATYSGDHRFDDCLADFSKSGLIRQRQLFETGLATLEAMDVAGWSIDEKIDRILLVQLAKQQLRAFAETRIHERNPGVYVDEISQSVFMLIMKDFAPIEDRLRSAAARMRAVPRLLSEAKANLVAAEVPRVWAELAIEQAGSAPGLFAGLLPQVAAGEAPAILDEVAEAGKGAAAAATAFIAFLRQDVLPHADGDFAVGEDLFNTILREDHLVDYNAREMLAEGWRQFESTEHQMAEIAKEIDPNKSVYEIIEEAKSDHPTAEGLLDAYRDAMNAARQFIIDHDVVTVPENESMQVIETPAFLRPVLPYAAYMSAGVFEESQAGTFIVTPVNPGASPEEQEQKLRGHTYAKLPITALHEAYPGHHLQISHANRTPTLPRRLGTFLSTLFAEGWAFYCEELMETLGYIAEPIQRLGRLKDQRWRAARIILDGSLHAGEMTVEEGVAFLVERCQLERTNALAEVRRYTQMPTQPQSYLMGKLELVKLIEEYKASRPEASLREIHDAILACGSLPPKLMRMALLGA
ncbi:DUF885 domain-containing protein [Candidatus Bipolaricaulota bacterium]|nr:DUF885 domain-containing protein [Candidatus Bipolaricaulota bacterium]